MYAIVTYVVVVVFAACAWREMAREMDGPRGRCAGDAREMARDRFSQADERRTALASAFSVLDSILLTFLNYSSIFGPIFGTL